MARIFKLENGTKVEFDTSKFKKLRNEYCKKKMMKRTKFDEELAEHIHVTVGAIRQWLSDNNGVSDFERLKEIAEFMELGDCLKLTKKVGDDMKDKLSERQKDSFRRIYDAIFDYIYFDHIKSENLRKYLEERRIIMSIMNNPECDDESLLEDLADKFIDLDSSNDYAIQESKYIGNIFQVYQREYFSLHGTALYDELYELIISMNSNIDEAQQMFTNGINDSKDLAEYYHEEQQSLREFVKKYN